MRRIKKITWAGAALITLCSMLISQNQLPSRAKANDAPSLVISQLKITSSNGQFVTLHNTTDDSLDMSKYRLEYFNHYDLSKATSSRLISLSGIVPPHGYFMINDNSMSLCYQIVINAASLGFSSTAGLVSVVSVHQSYAGSPTTSELEDYVGWSKTAASGVQILPANTNGFLLRQPRDSSYNPTISSPGSGSWQTVQPDPLDACKLVSIAAIPQVVLTGMNQLLPSSEAPATIIFANDGSGQPTATMPPGNIGLKAPSITELLPNPQGTGNDSSDEFIELYNSNSVAFDLSGFSLETGTTSTRSYIFPNGTKIPANSFVAYFSSETKLSLSNTGGQARIMDPFGNSIATSSIYASARDGNSWSVAKGKWYWTTTPTPAKANVIKEPPLSTKAKAKTKKAKTKGLAIIKKGNSKSSLAVAGNIAEEPSNTPVHNWMLAMIGSLALLYGAYEYRADLANKFHQLRGNIRNRRGDRQ